MPFRPSYRYHTLRFCLLWLLASLALTGGCGGSSGAPSPSPAPTTTRARFTILWEERNRAIIAPISALSAQITLLQGGLDRQDISFVVNRRAGGESYREAYAAPKESPLGEVEARIRFYAERDAQGVVVANAAARVPLGVDGHISEIVTQGTIASLQILPGQSVALGEPKYLEYVARARDGSILALPPQAIYFNIISGMDVLRVAEGRFEGIKAGTALVTARVDGQEGIGAQVDVAPPGGVTITPGSLTLTLQEKKTFTATVAGASSNGVIWAVEEGASGGTIDQGGYYTAPDNPGTYHVSATSASDVSKKTIAAVTVEAGGVSVGVD